MKRWLPWLIAVALLLAGGLWWLRQRAASSEAPRAAARPAATASSAMPTLELTEHDVLTIKPVALTRGLEVSGTVRAVNSAFVKARIAAEVKRLTVREGDTVRAGQLLAQLDTTEQDWKLRQAKQQTAGAQAQLDIAQRQLTNNQALVAQGFISPTALETSVSNEASARANLQAALAGVALAEKALADGTVTAPLGGLVAQRLVQVGERVAIDARLLEIVDLSAMELEAAIPPDDAPALRVGARASLQVDGGDATISARVVRINPSAATGSRAVPAYLAVTGHPSLRNGLFARGWIELDSKTAPALPVSAVRIDGARPYAIRIAQGKAEHRPLKLGIRGRVDDIEMVEVLDGLQPGDQVLAASAGLVMNGALLRQRASGPATATAGAATAASAAASR